MRQRLVLRMPNFSSQKMLFVNICLEGHSSLVHLFKPTDLCPGLNSPGLYL